MASLHGSIKCSLSSYQAINRTLKGTKSALKMFDLRQDRIKNRPEIRSISAMHWVTGNKSDLSRIPVGIHSIPYDSNSIPSSLTKAIGRKKNTKGIKASIRSTRLETISLGNYSSACKYTKFNYLPWIESWGYVVSDKALFFQLDTITGIFRKVIKAPKGFKWCIDKNGIKIQKNSVPACDYHPTSTDLYHFHSISKSLAIKANELFNIRKKQQTEIKSEKKTKADFIKAVKTGEKTGFLISLRDSIKAGNCEAGSTNFASRYGLDIHMHHSPSKVLGCDPSSRLVKLAIKVALNRHNQEMVQGFSLLANHATR